MILRCLEPPSPSLVDLKQLHHSLLFLPPPYGTLPCYKLCGMWAPCFRGFLADLLNAARLRFHEPYDKLFLALLAEHTDADTSTQKPPLTCRDPHEITQMQKSMPLIYSHSMIMHNIDQQT
jgi:hypothetical protein